MDMTMIVCTCIIIVIAIMMIPEYDLSYWAWDKKNKIKEQIRIREKRKIMAIVLKARKKHVFLTYNGALTISHMDGGQLSMQDHKEGMVSIKHEH